MGPTDFSIDPEGASVIKALRQRNPTPYCVVYSAVSLTPGAAESKIIREFANDELSKEAGLEEHVESILKWGTEYFSLSTLLTQLSALSGRSKDTLEEELGNLTSASDVRRWVHGLTKLDTAESLEARRLFRLLDDEAQP